MAYIGKEPNQKAVRNRFYYTATGGETSLSSTQISNFAFEDGAYVDVSLNGIALVAGTDYNTTTANTIGGLDALTADDVVEILVYEPFSVFSGNVNGDFSVNGALTVDTDTLHVDATNNKVGIGTTSPTTLMHLSGSSPRITLTDTGTGADHRINADSSVGNLAFDIDVNSDTTSPSTVFNIKGTERMRIDSSGNLLVGKTSVNSGIAGFEAESDGKIAATRDGARTAIFNRLTSDGEIVAFRKDGTSVGSIGVANNDIPYITCAEGTSGLRFDGDNNNIKPSNASGANLDDVISLGAGSTRFKNLYLSGGAYLGGTGSANYLDDYEEGTFTPTFDFATTSPTAGATSGTGNYTKIGNTVFATINFVNVNITGASGDVRIDGLPFAATTDGGHLFMGTPRVRSTTVNKYVTSFVVYGGSNVRLENNDGSTYNNQLDPSDFTHGATDVWLNFSYKTD